METAMKRPDAWTRFLQRFVRSDLDEQEARTERVVAHAENIKREADAILREYADADARFRRVAR